MIITAPIVTKQIKVSPSIIQENYRRIESGHPELCRPAIVILLPGQKPIEAYRVDILGPSRIVQNDETPHPTGARVWIETEAEIELQLKP